MPIPPASFELLVLSLKFQAEQGLGLMPAGLEPPAPVDLALARHALDLLGVLQDKTRGNLSPAEARLLEESLAELRLGLAQAEARAPQPQAVPSPPRTRAAAS